VNRAESPSGSRVPGGPHRSFTILKQRGDALSSQLRVAGQLTVLPTGKPFSGANPQASIARGEQAMNIAAGEMLTGRRLPWDVQDTIESKQAEFRAEPKITVGHLSN
jgi:hypothetical protein